MTRPLRFLFLEPFYGGSHRDFADGLKANSRHRIDLVTLPDRFWKWRMRGAALYWSESVKDAHRYDGLITSSLLNLPDLAALWGRQCPPALVYFHENQLTYPGAGDEREDLQPVFTNITTALAARRVLFNSCTQRRSFLDALPRLLGMMPDRRPKWVTRAIETKSAVAYPGCHFAASHTPAPRDAGRPPLIVWNHRWEHDKNPDAFFKALEKMIILGVAFEVALLGQTYTRIPRAFEQARQMLGSRLVQFGHVPSRRDYFKWLARGHVVVSTAFQENFGIAVVEAVRHGCLPLLPRRLSYPEILPQRFHREFLYQDQQELETRLADLLKAPEEHRRMRLELSAAMTPYAWSERIGQFDEELSLLAGRDARA